MDRKSKILVWVFFVLIIASASFTYYRTMVVRDYPVINSESGLSSN